MLMGMLRNRIADESLMRLVGKCLHVGVLDVWFEREVQPQLRGRSTLVRYADDLVRRFERAADAQKVWGGLDARFKRFGLALPGCTPGCASSVARWRCRTGARFREARELVPLLDQEDLDLALDLARAGDRQIAAEFTSFVWRTAPGRAREEARLALEAEISGTKPS
jgi:hypothetical protein